MYYHLLVCICILSLSGQEEQRGHADQLIFRVHPQLWDEPFIKVRVYHYHVSEYASRNICLDFVYLSLYHLFRPMARQPYNPCAMFHSVSRRSYPMSIRSPFRLASLSSYPLPSLLSASINALRRLNCQGVASFFHATCVALRAFKVTSAASISHFLTPSASWSALLWAGPNRLICCNSRPADTLQKWLLSWSIRELT